MITFGSDLSWLPAVVANKLNSSESPGHQVINNLRRQYDGRGQYQEWRSPYDFGFEISRPHEAKQRIIDLLSSDYYLMQALYAHSYIFPNFKCSAPIIYSESLLVADSEKNDSFFQHKPTEQNYSLMDSPVFPFILLDAPLLNLVETTYLAADATEASIRSDELIKHGIDPCITSVLSRWLYHHTQKPHRAPDSPIESILQPLMAENNYELPFSISPMNVKALILLHLNFFSDKGAHNANKNSLKHFFHYARSLKKHLDNDPMTVQNFSTHQHVYTLLSEFSPTEKWYYEMATGLSLSAALTCTILYLKSGPDSTPDNQNRIQGLYSFLTLFRDDIVSYPAPFSRCFLFSQILLDLFKSDGVLSLSQELKCIENYPENERGNLKKGLRKKYSFVFNKFIRQMGLSRYFVDLETLTAGSKRLAVREELPDDPPNFFDYAMNLHIDPIFAFYPDHLLLTNLNTDPSEGNFNRFLKLVNFDSLQTYNHLYCPDYFLEFPFGFCFNAIPQSNLFSKPYRFPPDIDHIFSEIHFRLYPNGYEPLKFSSNI